MPATWTISWYPPCQYHVFLSHCAEDRQELIFPVAEELRSRKIIPWLDRHDYPLGAGAHRALQEGILKCRHVVYFVTRRILAQGRGRSSLENAYGQLLQDNRTLAGLEMVRVQLPLLFVPPSNKRFARSIWQVLFGRGVLYEPGMGDPVIWAAARIQRFVDQEKARAVDLATTLEADPSVRQFAETTGGLADRIRAVYPQPMLP